MSDLTVADTPRILVTGGNGFVGRRLVSRLTGTSGDNGVVLGLSGPSGPPSSAVGVDLSDADDTRRVISEFDPSVIVHLAAQSSVGTSAVDPASVWRMNFDATRNVAESALGLGHRVSLVFASTAEVYGRAFLDGPRTEESGIAPQSPYARSKAAAEMLLRDLAGDALNVVVLRLFNHTGPGQDTRFVTPSFAAQLASLVDSQDAVIRVGNLDAQRDFTDIDDIIEAYARVIANPEQGSGNFALFNVGSGIQRSIRSVLDILVSHHGKPVEAVLDPERQRPAEIPVAQGVFDRFKSTYDWSATTPFATTLAAIYNYERSRVEADSDA